MKGHEPVLCVEHSSNERKWVSNDVGGTDVRDRVYRVLRRYAGRGAVKTACRGTSERL